MMGTVLRTKTKQNDFLKKQRIQVRKRAGWPIILMGLKSQQQQRDTYMSNITKAS